MLFRSLFGGLLLLICFAYRPGRQGDAGDAKRRSDSVLALQRELLGDITRREVLAGSVITALLVGFATQPLHGVEPLWLTVLAFTVLGAAKVMTADTFRSVNWSFLLLLGALGATPEVFANAKVDAWLATLFTGLLQLVSGSSALFLSAVAVLSFVLSSVMRWQPASLLLAITLAPMGGGMGIDPWRSEEHTSELQSH